MLFSGNRSLISRLGCRNRRAYRGQTETNKQNKSRRSKLHLVAPPSPGGAPRGGIYRLRMRLQASSGPIVTQRTTRKRPAARVNAPKSAVLPKADIRATHCFGQ